MKSIDRKALFGAAALTFAALGAGSALSQTPAPAGGPPAASPSDMPANPAPNTGQPTPPSDMGSPPATATSAMPAADAPAGQPTADTAAPPAQSAMSGQPGAGSATTVTNGPIPDTPANRAKYGMPQSHAGKKTPPKGN